MKKLVFHIALSVALFCVLTALFIGDNRTGFNVYKVDKADEESVTIFEGEGYKCVGKTVEIVEMPQKVRAGDKVFLKFRGESYTEYEIKVYYPSGQSESHDLSPRKSDENGDFGWEFTVSNNAREGKLRISVLSESSYLLTEIEAVS